MIENVWLLSANTVWLADICQTFSDWQSPEENVISNWGPPLAVSWWPNNHAYVQFCICLWALSGSEVGYIQVQKMFCAESIFEKWFGGQTIVDTCSSAFVCGPCRAWWWDIFNYRLCCVQSLFSDGPSWPCNMLTKWELDHWHIDQVRSWTTGNLTKNFSTTSMRHLPMGTVS